MNKIFAYADEYVRQSSWKDFALVKFCLCSMGILLGIAAPKNARRLLSNIAMIVFVATYIPLITKFFRIVRENKE